MPQLDIAEQKHGRLAELQNRDGSMSHWNAFPFPHPFIPQPEFERNGNGFLYFQLPNLYSVRYRHLVRGFLFAFFLGGCVCATTATSKWFAIFAL